MNQNNRKQSETEESQSPGTERNPDSSLYPTLRSSVKQQISASASPNQRLQISLMTKCQITNRTTPRRTFYSGLKCHSDTPIFCPHPLSLRRLLIFVLLLHVMSLTRLARSGEGARSPCWLCSVNTARLS